MSATRHSSTQAELRPHAHEANAKNPLSRSPVGEAKAKQSGREKSDAIRKKTDEALQRLVEALRAGKSAELRRFLSVMGRFHKYSISNQMLVALQAPEATRVAGYRAGQKLGRQVLKGEKSIKIIAPLIRKAREGERGDEDGNVVLGFRLASVFDVSQTEGDGLPELRSAAGEPGEYLTALESFAESRPIAVEYVDECVIRGAAGVSALGTIQIRKGQSPAETFSTLAHEIAHELMHDRETRRELEPTVQEIEAEAVAFAVGQGIGLDQLGASADYLQLYKGDAQTLLASLERIQKAAGEILEFLTSRDLSDREPTASK